MWKNVDNFFVRNRIIIRLYIMGNRIEIKVNKFLCLKNNVKGVPVI